MISSLHLKCFRKHEDLQISFARGLNVLRGANEAGKSTVLEGILYALYGTKALRDSLAETVTWGHKESALSSTLVIVVGGVTFTFKRSKSGAEMSASDGRRVTGQEQVTKFAGELLGADAKTAGVLMMSSQSGLRGALDEGPTAISGLMSKLADFDLIDRVVESAQANLLLGSDAPIQQRLTQAEADLDEARKNTIEADSWKPIEADMALAESALTIARSSYQAAHAAFVEVETELNEALEYNGALDTERRALEQLIRARDEAAAALASTPMPFAPGDGAIEAARARVQRETDVDAQVRAYERVQGLRYPLVFWDTDKASLEAALRETRTRETEANQTAMSNRAEVRNLTRSLMSGGRCTLCGHEATPEHVESHNDEIRAQIGGHEALSAAAQAQQRELYEEVRAYEEILQAGQAFETAAANLEAGNFPVTIDRSVYPWRITWDGPVPGASAAQAARSDLAKLEAQQAAAQKAAGARAALQQRLDTAEQRVATTQAALAGRVEIPTQDLAAEYSNLSGRMAVADDEVQTFLNLIHDCQTRIDGAKQAYEMQQVTVRSLEQRIAEHRADLKTLAFNNTLVKKLRGLKPAITDHLWGTVLAAVSTFFSTLRGEQSVVTKEAGGFKVNGKSVESLSGSTLDVLALSIRVALSKTFIPHASFIVLDEPAHGCDNTRTSNVLGFLASVGFEQTLLASHDELSEAVADNTILIGA